MATLPLLLLLAAVSTDPATSLRDHVEFLADDARRGRATGEPGCREAADYIAQRFDAAGLRPLEPDDWFLDYQLTRTGFDPDRTRLRVRSDRWRDAEPGEDFRPFPFSGEGRVRAPAVFAGYGIVAPEHGVDDYAGLDVAGRVVLVLRYEPGRDDPESPFDGVSHSRHAHFETKAEVARRHGASALLVVTGPAHADAVDRFTFGDGLDLVTESAEAPLLAAHVDRRWLRRALGVSTEDLREWQEQAEAGRRPDPWPEVEVELDVRRTHADPEVDTHNVAGWVPGTEPALAEEWIVVGAHHDHIGESRGRIHNGADDNASGVAVLLEVASRIAAAPLPRPVCFVTFSGEEIGLLGSTAFVEHQQIPRERMVWMLNLDMVGRNPDAPLQVVGDGYATGLREIIADAASASGVDIDFHGTAMSDNSDHAPFFEARIPVAAFFSGFHRDYHRPGDDADKLDYPRMARITDLAERTLRGVATRDPRTFPRFLDPVAWGGFDVAAGPDGPEVVRVDEGGPMAGRLQPGDRLVAVDGERLGVDDAGWLASLEPGTYRLRVVRDGETVEAELTRGVPGFLGIQPGELPGRERRALGLQPGQGVRVDGLVEGGPAEQGGLREGDVVVAIDGREVGPRDLVGRLSALGEGRQVALDVLREEEPLRVELRLGRRR